MVEDDIAAVAAIEREAFPRPWREESLRTELHRPAAVGTTRESRADGRPRVTALVATLEGAVVAFAIVWVLETEAHVARIAVAQSARRRSLATLLMDRVVAIARSTGVGHVALEVREDNAAAVALYLSLGFVTCGTRRGYYTDGPERLDARLLVLTL